LRSELGKPIQRWTLYRLAKNFRISANFRRYAGQTH